MEAVVFRCSVLEVIFWIDLKCHGDLSRIITDKLGQNLHTNHNFSKQV